jgi:signal transduction histidine kinase
MITRPTGWSLALRVPLMVGGLVVVVASVFSLGVLQRLEQDQRLHLAQLAATYLDGMATAVQPALLQRDIWEAFAALDRARMHYEGPRAVSTAVLLADGRVLAAADPRAWPSGVTLPADVAERAARAAAGEPILDPQRARATLARDLFEGGIPIGRIVAELDIAPLLKARAKMRQTLILASAALTLLFAGAGFLLVRVFLRPVETLRRHVLASAATGGLMLPLPPEAFAHVGNEFNALFQALNRTASAVAEREDIAARLAEEERFAQLGRLASSMAHEVNNPLGGMMTAVDTIATHGSDPAIRAASLGFLQRGLADIANVVRANLASYKGEAGAGPLRATDLDDLRHLVRHEMERRGIRLEWSNTLPAELAVDRTLVRQIVLNLLLNATAVSSAGGTVSMHAGEKEDLIRIEIADAGPGLPADAAAMLEAPQATPPRDGGLGLWTASRLAARLGGALQPMPAAQGTIIALLVPSPRPYADVG